MIQISVIRSSVFSKLLYSFPRDSFNLSLVLSLTFRDLLHLSIERYYWGWGRKKSTILTIYFIRSATKNYIFAYVFTGATPAIARFYSRDNDRSTALKSLKSNSSLSIDGTVLLRPICTFTRYLFFYLYICRSFSRIRYECYTKHFEVSLAL